MGLICPVESTSRSCRQEILIIPKKSFSLNRWRQIMKNIIASLTIFLLAISVASGSTIIPGGDVSGTWNLAGSPYIIEGDISIQSGDTLIVEPEVEVRFDPDVLMWIRGGYLQADGTTGPGVGDTIRFTSNLPNPQYGDWDGFKLSEYGSADMKFCSFEFGDLFNAYYNDPFQLTDCTLEFPLSGEPSHLTMLRCNVNVNQTFYGASYLVLDQCAFSGYLYFQEGPGVNYTIQSCTINDDLRLLDYAATFTVTNTTVDGDVPISNEGTSYLTECHIDGHVSGADVTYIDNCYIGSGVYWANEDESGVIDLFASIINGDITIGDWIYAHIQNCTIEGDILLEGCRNVNFGGNDVQGGISGSQSCMAYSLSICNNQFCVGGIEITLNDAYYSVSVSGNQINNPPADGIRIDSGGNNVSLCNNVISGAGGHGIVFVDTYRDSGALTCNNNIITLSDEDGILFDLNGYANWSCFLDFYSNSIYSAEGNGIRLLVGGAGEILFCGVNNIISSCGEYGWYTTGWLGASPEYGDVWNNASGNYGGGFGSGSGSISLDPQFVDPENGDLNLQRISPCIDTGDPQLTPDPDGTRSDMGALYFHQDMPVKLTLTPEDPPIVVPGNGGTFNFNIEVTNRTGEVQAFDLWTEIELPGWGSVMILSVTGLSIAIGDTIDRDRTQQVPEFAPAGTYTYLAYVGTYPWVVDDYYYFSFEKEGSDEGGSLGTSSDWLCRGEDFDQLQGDSRIAPTEFILMDAYPNPFNPSTNITFALPIVSQVNLKIFDPQGRLITELINGWRDAGMHEVTFDGVLLSSGIYIYRLTAGEFTASGKMVLMK
ncbi:hypothetical protein CEE37_13325 [candidate division LCP-89 bacterium B3_LCP]|uniref:Secretion system C-terminal sorting domain-containing protein n=1 Tax=candidate division LCP-89 bacterium B3_LCP TaxID=2012998 RepID=A0A532USM8_UNCL8|nr:MAG: hypothetical protein CEE37_13325 [candidate division LCP-89 bacterium B3_LCP]